MNFPPDLVIFDCDGVLVDSEPITTALLADDLAARGLELSPDEAAERFIGGTLADVARRVQEIGLDLPDSWVDDFYARAFARLEEGTPPIPGIHDALDAIEAAGILISVASNGPMGKMEITLGQNGLFDRLMPHIVSPHDIGLHLAKPNPGLFAEAAARRNVPASRCVVVEDSATGARAAQAAGMHCFGYAADTPSEKLTAHGSVPFFAMSDLPGLLGL